MIFSSCVDVVHVIICTQEIILIECMYLDIIAVYMYTVCVNKPTYI